ncbi:ribonuclease T [Isoalcanivorax pacificus W11-5]|uniref:Ribonuclease T n=1 Tax=Isoalcanivorax pacificus W11-5 TaxID=391936 RepID=A0A0B4XNV3_9GAMM|nr:ribonuclease T [Isoalcanivorax pacificus W11-5]
MAGIPFSQSQAHSALYGATRTAELFCTIVNRWRNLGGWPPTLASKSGDF